MLVWVRYIVYKGIKIWDIQLKFSVNLNHRMICIFRINPKVGLTKNHPYIICILGLHRPSSTSQLNHANEKIASEYWENLQIQKQEDQSITVCGFPKSPQVLRAHSPVRLSDQSQGSCEQRMSPRSQSPSRWEPHRQWCSESTQLFLKSAVPPLGFLKIKGKPISKKQAKRNLWYCSSATNQDLLSCQRHVGFKTTL